MSVNLYLMTYKGYHVLQYLIAKGYHAKVNSVIIGEDAALANDYANEIRILCDQSKLHYLNRKQTPPPAELSLAISWRWMLPSEGLIVLHDSLLPKYRGFAPLVNCLKNGETEIGVTALFASAEYDTGEIIHQSRTTISYPIKIQEAIERISFNYLECVDFLFEKIIRGESITGYHQNEQDATYSVWLDEADYLIPWNNSSSYIRRFVDATGPPYKGASAMLGKTKIRVLEVQELPDVIVENRTPGKVLFIEQGLPIVICGQGLLKIIKAVDDSTNMSVLPLSKFRSRFY